MQMKTWFTFWLKHGFAHGFIVKKRRPEAFCKTKNYKISQNLQEAPVPVSLF